MTAEEYAAVVATHPLVTILITNYNYAHFLPTAIDSALAQSYEPLEVIVVDDGSRDGSRDAISAYGVRVTPVYKENGGQASALHAGFARSKGDVVVFLDADDILLEGIVARVVAAFRERPQVGLVQYRVQAVDEACTPLDAFIPAAHVRMPSGDLRRRVRDITNNSWWSPTSGLAIASTILRRVFPLPEDVFRISADYPLCRASALCAPVRSLEDVGAYYRSHGANNYKVARIDVDKMRADALLVIESQRFLREFAKTVGVEGYPSDPYSTLDAMFLTQRMVLLKLGSKDGCLPGDTLASVASRGLRAVAQRRDVSPLVKLLHASWFLVMLATPRRVADWVVHRSVVRNTDGPLAALSRSLRLRRRTGDCVERGA